MQPSASSPPPCEPCVVECEWGTNSPIVSVSDVRSFFSAWTESRNFICFHILPQSQQNGDSCAGRRNSKLNVTGTVKLLPTVVPVVLVPSSPKFPDSSFRRFKQRFDGQQFTLQSGEPVHGAVIRIRRPDKQYSLHAPNTLPKGNIGTPLKDILKAIRRCTIPCSALRKMGLKDLAGGGTRCKYKEKFWTPTTASLSSNAVDSSRYRSSIPEHLKEAKPNILDGRLFAAGDFDEGHTQRDDRDSETEEWDRVEQPAYPYRETSGRLPTDDILYEEQCDNPWDKHDASGLVFYTDSAIWDGLKGGLDERTTDSMDVEEGYVAPVGDSQDAEELFDKYVKAGKGGKLFAKSGGAAILQGAEVARELRITGQRGGTRRGIGCTSQKSCSGSSALQSRTASGIAGLGSTQKSYQELQKRLRRIANMRASGLLEHGLAGTKSAVEQQDYFENIISTKYDDECVHAEQVGVLRRELASADAGTFADFSNSNVNRNTVESCDQVQCTDAKELDSQDDYVDFGADSSDGEGKTL